MPGTKKKRRNRTISKNVKKLVDQWKRTGKIKTSRATYRPKTKKAAIKQVLAIELGRMRKKRK
jgi:hypothetical protein